MLFGLLCLFQLSVDAADITPFNDEESAIGLGCAIVNAQGVMLVSDNMIKIDGIKRDLNVVKVSKNSKLWKGTDIKVSFTLDKGKLLENNDYITNGGRKTGKLTFDYKGIQRNIKAFEECYGAE